MADPKNSVNRICGKGHGGYSQLAGSLTGGAKAAMVNAKPASLASILSSAQTGVGVQGGLRTVETSRQPVLTLEAFGPAWAVLRQRVTRAVDKWCGILRRRHSLVADLHPLADGTKGQACASEVSALGLGSHC